MTSYVDAIVDEIEGALSRASTELDVLQLRGPAVIRELTSISLDDISPLPVPGFIKNEIANRLIAEMMEMIAYARKVVAVNEKMAHMLGSPDALRAGATALDNNVNKASGDLATNVRPDSLAAMDDDTKWDGGASQQYAKSFVGQNDAVDRIGHYGQILEATLGKLADAIEQYYVELLVAVLSVVSAIVLAVVTILAAVGVVTIPVAVITAIGAGLSVIAAIAAIVAAMITIMQEVSDSLGDLHSNLQAWPKATFAS